MFTFKLKNSLFVPCLTLFISTPLFSTEKLSLLLQQSVDANCDGVLEAPYTSELRLKALPKQCIMYKVSAKNISEDILYNIVINGKTPLQTHVLFHRSHFYKNDELHQNSVFNAKRSAQLNSKVTTLLPNHTITLLYSVRVNEGI